MADGDQPREFRPREGAGATSRLLEELLADPAAREILFDLENLRASLSAKLDAQSPEMLILAKTIANLQRRVG